MKLTVNHSFIPGCYEILSSIFKDERGTFTKVFHKDSFKENRLETDFREEYYSISYKGVLRGLHFQKPPADHVKLVACLLGEVLDIVVDLRVGSPTYGKYEIFELCPQRANMVYIPKGLAHGFYVTSEKAIIQCKTSTIYSLEHDSGILWSSIGIEWKYNTPILSKKDKELLSLSDFQSPFIYDRKGGQ